MFAKADFLNAAQAAVADRGLNYGKPEDNFARIATRWRAHIFNRYGIDAPLDGAVEYWPSAASANTAK